MPDVAGVDDRVAGVELDQPVLAVDLLDEVDPSAEEDDELLTRGVAFLAIPGRVPGHDADQATLVAIAREQLAVAVEELRAPVEVGNRDRPHSETEVDERARKVERWIRHTKASRRPGKRPDRVHRRFAVRSTLRSVGWNPESRDRTRAIPGRGSV
jgi:hypothetical protein